MGSAAKHRLASVLVGPGPHVLAIRLALVLAFAVTAACRSRLPGGTSASPSSGATAATSSGAPMASARLDLSRRPAPQGSRFATDPLWRRAGTEDVLDLGRLAESEGALGLLEGVRAEGSVALVSLAALPLAPDAELAAGSLCDLLELATPREPLLQAIHGILSRPPRQSERLDLAGLARCETRLRRRAEESLAAGQRDLVSSALAMLVEAGIPP